MLKKSKGKLYNSLWLSIKKWMRQTFNGNDDDNGPFDSPFAIL